MTSPERYEENTTARSANRFCTDDLFHGPVGPLYEQVGLQRSDGLGGRVLVKHDDEINRAQRAQNTSPGALVLDWTRRPFEAPDRCIAVDRDISLSHSAAARCNKETCPGWSRS
jgi:hypothetical protein